MLKRKYCCSSPIIIGINFARTIHMKLLASGTKNIRFYCVASCQEKRNNNLISLLTFEI